MRHLVLASVCLFAAAAAAQDKPDEAQLNERLTLNFRETRLEMVISAVQETVKVNLVVDPAVDLNAAVSAEVSDQPVSVLLAQLEQALGLQHTFWAGVVVLHPKGKGPGAEPEAPKGPEAKLLAQRVTVSFQDARLGEVIERLKVKTNQEFAVLSFPVRKHLRARGESVTLKLWDVRLRDVLHHVARACDLKWYFDKSSKVVFSTSSTAEASATEDDPNRVDYDVLRGDTYAKGATVDVDRLVRQLSSPRNRDTAVQLLVREGKPALGKVAAALKQAVDGEDPATALAALQIMTEVGDPQEYAAVLYVFKDQKQSVDVRAAAGEALTAMKPPEAVEDLILALDDPWFRVSETARTALIAIGEPAVGPLATRFRAELKAEKPRDGILFRALLIFGEIDSKLAKRTLLTTLQETTGTHDRAVAIRHHAAIGVGLTGDLLLVEPLIAALKREKDFRVGKYIARSLTWITDHEGPGTNGDRWQIWWELEGKKKLLQPRSAEDVLEGVAGGEVEVPLDAKGLPILESQEQRLKRLAEQLGHEDAGKRRAAWRELEALGTAALPTLREVLKTGNPRARANARAIIARIEGTGEE